MKAAQISAMINEIYDGVERSKVGDIMQKNKDGTLLTNDEGYKRLNSLPMNTFLALLPKPMTGQIKVEE